MVQQDELKIVKQGSSYVWGKMTKQHDKLNYLKEDALVCLFDGVDTALDMVTKEMTEPLRGKSSSDNGRGRFQSFETYEKAMDTFRNKPEDVVDYDPTEIRVTDLTEIGNQVEYDVTGDYIDMGRYMEGIPESMGSMHGGRVRSRRVNIILNLNFYAGVNQSVIKHRSERIIRLVDALEQGGVRTNITAIQSSECDHVEVLVKRHDEPLNISDVAVVTHSDFLRRTLFRIIENSDTYNYGYGNAVQFGYCLTPKLVDSDNNDELNIVIDSNLSSKEEVTELFDKLERLLAWEMSKPVPEMRSVKLGRGGIRFSPNGARDNATIQREGMEILNSE